MSEEWIFYPCQMEENLASIFLDYGIRELIDDMPQRNLLKVHAPFKQPLPNGMYSPDEFDALSALEDSIKSLIDKQGSCYVGRVTVNGYRHFYVYTNEAEAVWAAEVESLGATHGYDLGFAWKPDEEHAGYWEELYPTADDWQVISDMSVLDSLNENGDDGTSIRRVDHWAYFPTQTTASEFGAWLRGQGYVVEDDIESDENEFRVRFAHDISVSLAEISSHTISLRRKADEIGGKYDGWETVVCKNGDST